MPEPHNPTTYAEAGVNLDLGDAASQLLYRAARHTWEQRQGRFGEVIIPHDDFSGVRCIAVGMLPPDAVMGIGFDGIGTKIEIAERLGVWKYLAFDLFAMVCDDAVVQGQPVLIGLGAWTCGRWANGGPNLDSIPTGEGAIARNHGGRGRAQWQLAECPRISGYGPFNCTWSAGVIWFARRSRLLSGAAVRRVMPLSV